MSRSDSRGFHVPWIAVGILHGLVSMIDGHLGRDSFPYVGGRSALCRLDTAKWREYFRNRITAQAEYS